MPQPLFFEVRGANLQQAYECCEGSVYCRTHDGKIAIAKIREVLSDRDMHDCTLSVFYTDYVRKVNFHYGYRVPTGGWKDDAACQGYIDRCLASI